MPIFLALRDAGEGGARVEGRSEGLSGRLALYFLRLREGIVSGLSLKRGL
jgi:hypothetical protein